MNKLLLAISLIILSTSCTIRKEGGKWAVKKTIIDEVQESVEGTKELVKDVKDANEDLSEQQEDIQQSSKDESLLPDSKATPYKR